MTWKNHFEVLTTWAFKSIDLRYAYYFADAPDLIGQSPGLELVIERSLTLAMFEAYLGKGYKIGRTIDYERQYPSSTSNNPERVDLAFKEPGKGQKWAFVETKYWHSIAAINKDIAKLKDEQTKMSRWLLLYWIRPDTNKTNLTAKLLTTPLLPQLWINQAFSVPTRTVVKKTSQSGKLKRVVVPGTCDIVLCKVT